MGQANSQSARGVVGGCLALKLRRRKHMASGAIRKRSCCREGYDPQSRDLHISQLLRPVCSIWPVVRGRVLVGELLSAAFQ